MLVFENGGDVSLEFFESDLGDFGLRMHERVEGPYATLGIDENGAEIVGDHILRVEAISGGDFAAGFEADLVGEVVPGA